MVNIKYTLSAISPPAPVKRLPLKELKEFSITANKNEEFIEIKSDKKDFIFVRDNSNEDNLALAMSKVINDIK